MELPSIYLASRYGRRDELRGYAEKLRELGYTITSRWLFENHEFYPNATDYEKHLANIRFAAEDLQDISDAQVFVVFTEDVNNPPAGSFTGGRFVETGYAIAQHKAVIVIGKPENVFHWLPDIIGYHTFEEFFTAMYTNVEDARIVLGMGDD